MKTIPLKGLNKLNEPQTFYLPLAGKTPIILGTGRNAVVFLGRTTSNDNDPGNDYLAFKFLKNDVNQQYAAMIAQRFFKEAEQTRRFGQVQDYFVRYWGLGTIGALEQWSSKLPVDDLYRNDSEAHLGLMHRFSLQGPFYIAELCQGSIHDILERDAPWVASSSTYAAIKAYEQTLGEQAGLAQDDLNRIREEYIRPDAHQGNLSGYDILNAFVDSSEANKVRNYALLDLFNAIVWTVFQLHENALTHRDLKPGNLFIRHGVGRRGFRNIDFKLADLGYVADVQQLTHGDWSLQIDGWRNPGATIPGSLFYRAPEQIELPYEVRVTIDQNDKRKVWIKASKIIDIEKGDWLAIGDMFRNEEEPAVETEYVTMGMPEQGVFKIEKVEKPSKQSFCLTLATTKGIHLDKEDDLQAHIIKLTGFHTDGFSLGAMLYDLVSGGKNPEAFYTYCLLRFHKGMGQIHYSIENVMNVLAPEQSGLSTRDGAIPTSAASLTTLKKAKVVREVGRARSIDDLINAILSTSVDMGVDGEKVEEALDNYRFKKFPLVSDLLEDKRGVPIPADILELIIKCMLRDIEGSYYSSRSSEGFFDESNLTAVRQLHRDVMQLLSKPENKLPDDFPEYFQQNLLIKLKMFWNHPGPNGKVDNSATLIAPAPSES